MTGDNMPKANTKKKAPPPVVPVAPAPPEPPASTVVAPPPDLPVIYETLEITEYSTTSPKGPLTVEDIDGLLGWETEKQYQERMVSEKGGKPEHYVFGDVGIRHEDGSVSPVHCKDLAGQKVVTKFNAQNRPFDQGWCDSLVHTILHGQWAGPHTVPGETVNGETIRVSKYGRVLSGQHQMTACMLADEILQKARADGIDTPENPKYPAWVGHDHVFLETIVLTGMSEDPRVLMTVDYVKPRTAADVFYTSSTFKDSTPPERKELCRMLAAAVDMLWTRTDARGYRTHPEIVGFLERHRRLLKCVEHVFAENSAESGRKLSKMRLSPGQCAALMYLMASAGPRTDGDDYRNEEPAPSEKGLDWSLWDRAEEFWTLLAGGRDFSVVRTALGQLIDSTPSSETNQGQGGRGPEKLAIVAKAWDRWKDHPASAGPAFDPEDLAPGGDLCLSYSDLDDRGNKLPDGQVKLLDVADFYGIDCPESVGKGQSSRGEPMPPAPSQEEIERATREALERRAQAAAGGKK